MILLLYDKVDEHLLGVFEGKFQEFHKVKKTLNYTTFQHYLSNKRFLNYAAIKLGENAGFKIEVPRFGYALFDSEEHLTEISGNSMLSLVTYYIEDYIKDNNLDIIRIPNDVITAVIL